ncbi:MAG: nucleoside-triphosphatase [Oscillospiraceae bacterium]|jgi:nucleoside-triphosphatase|nr:nucleoside-triphosphatase [Oscillospiraceae bacterium]
MKNIFLTGIPCVGKTTILERYLERSNIRTGGYFTTREITETSRAFWLNDRVTLESRLMARMVDGEFNVNLAAFDEFAVSAITRPRDLLVLDELGRFEEPCEPFKRAVFDALDGGTVVTGVLKECDTPFVNSIKARNDVAVLIVTEENREEMFLRFCELINSAFS